MVIIIDTNVIIDHLRQKSKPATIYKNIVEKYEYFNLAISTITIQELFIGQSTKENRDLQKLTNTIKPLKLLALTPRIARLAGELMRDNGPKLQFADAAIAATALHYGAHLATLNTKDFVGIPNLKLLKLPSV